MSKTSNSKQKANANNFSIKPAQRYPTFRPLLPVTSLHSSMYFLLSPPLSSKTQAQAPLSLPLLLQLP